MKNTGTNNRILVVSDDFTVCESMSDRLRSADFKVLCAKSGREAVEALQANTVSGIVLDYRTPFDPNGEASLTSRSLAALTDIDPFLPLVLTCEPGAELGHPTTLMADLVLRHPVPSSALLDGIDMLLAESLRDRVYRKSEYTALLR